MIRRFTATLLLFALATGLRAETYQDWEKAVPHPRPISFQGWLAPTTIGSTISEDNESSINEVSTSIFQTPFGRLFGHLDFSSYPPVDFPLRVRVLYYRIGEAERNRAGNGLNLHVPEWTSPLKYVLPNASMEDLIESREVSIPNATEGRAVPVWSIWSQNFRGAYGGGFNPYAVLVEVATPDGTLLARQRLIEAVAFTANSNVTLAKTDSGAESELKSLGNVISADVLPMEEGVYENVKVLWLDAATLHDPTYPDGFWHRVFFAGTQVMGHDTEVQELAQRLGLTPNQRVLRGGLWTASHVEDVANLISPPQTRYGSLSVKVEQNPFLKSVVLGEKRKHQLRTFSIWFVISFTVFEIAVIVGSFYFLQGGRRVLRWFLIPLSAVHYTAAGMVVVHGIVDFRPEVQIFREVDTVEGWPESFVSTTVMRLGFNEDRTAFAAPAQATYSWSAISLDSTPLASTETGDRTTFSMRQRYGRFSLAKIQYGQPAELPCHVTPDRQVTATRPLRGAWLWDGKVWRNLGRMEPGKPVAFDKAAVVIDAKDYHEGATQPLIYQNGSDGSMPETVLALINTTYTKSLQGTNVGLMLAVDDRALPEEMTDAAGSEIHPQTLLIHQFQLPAPVVTTRP